MIRSKFSRTTNKNETKKSKFASSNQLPPRNELSKTNKGKASEKRPFIPRESILTDLMQISHIDSIYNIFIAVLIMLFISTTVHDWITKNKLNVGFNLIRQHFKLNQFPSAIFIWIEIMTFALVAFYANNFWLKIRRIIDVKQQAAVDTIYYIFNVSLVITMLFVPCLHIVVKGKLSSTIKGALLAEQVRHIMKVYSFLRETIPQTNSLKSTLSQFVYFLFAPTLIYRDHYPRTKRIRWDYVVKKVVEILSVIIYFAFMLERYVLPNTQDIKPGIQWTNLILKMFDNALPSITIYIFGFFIVLHAWQNLFAELLRFADRMFYKDWWNATDFSSFLRNWNTVVYDWLYIYIYRDAVEHLGTTRITAKAMVLITSALFHEYLAAFSFGYSLPLFLISYFFMMIVISIRITNVGLWFLLIVGTGLFSTVYISEGTARVNCPQKYDSTIIDFFYPRLLSCFS